ncbi:MAG TPA: hypothetical protein VGK61_04595 [Planctomycetota bacterium]
MRFPGVLLILPALGLAGGPQDGKFESPDYGIRLKIPAGWTVDSTKLVQVVLKLALPGDKPFRSELIIRELPFPEEHITIGQYREQIRQLIQRTYRDPRILEDRDAKVGGRPGFVLVTASRTTSDADAMSYRCLVELSPSRLLWVEAIVPREGAGAAAKTFDALLGSIEFFPRQAPAGTEEGLKKFAEAAAKLPVTEAKFEGKVDMEYALGDNKVGSYQQELKAGTREGAAGIEVKTVDVIDLGTKGRLEKRTTAFLSDDLARQWGDVEIVHKGPEGRTQYFTATVKVEGTAATIERRINGEKSSTEIKVPERTVLLELLEALQVRLLASPAKGVVSVPVLPAFDNEAGHVAIELRGKHEMKADAGLVDVHIVVVQREDGTLINYWYDADRRMIRRTVGGQSIVLQTRK